jgi:hypothetical protein
MLLTWSSQFGKRELTILKTILCYFYPPYFFVCYCTSSPDQLATGRTYPVSRQASSQATVRPPVAAEASGATCPDRMVWQIEALIVSYLARSVGGRQHQADS